MERCLLFLAVLLIFSTGCEESVEGCLNSRAANFDVTAVTACDDCCTLPEVKLDVELGYDTLRLTYGTEYPLIDSDSVRILSFEVPVSVFSFYKDGLAQEVVDTLLGFSTRKRDDYLAISQSSKYEIGHTDFDVDFDSYSCLMGYDRSEVESLKPYIDINPTNKVLGLLGKFYNDTTEVYSQLNMILQLKDSIRMISVSEIADPMVLIDFDDNVSKSPGLNWEVDMRIDLKAVLNGVKATLTDEEIATLISQNLSGAITEN